ncbi:rho GTPase-activating protein 31 [Brachyhypopomus gauderio]|uniref:rho GTPase-activating protein 31 n=1 Tax=Brachyhypopomus gauderio TaxID=698409 RepID=UPI004040F9E9
MKNKSAKQKSKRKGSENVFGCDLTEYLQHSGQEVPQVLKICAEFIEKHGVVDGIYRLSGITSNIQRLRQEFISELCPDLTKEVYLQDIHCVGSLCKLYFRELPNPLLTYELYQKFTDAVSIKEEDEQLRSVRRVIKELPASHFRTLEFLVKHLSHLATLSHSTNMHTRNLALVWAPNLLRSKEIEVSSCNGDEAFLEVRVQQSVVEFILNHTEQLFNHEVEISKSKEGPGVMCREKYATLPAVSQDGPMKLMSLEEAQARSLSPSHPARKEQRQRENSLPDPSTAAMYHTVIDLTESKRKFSGKSKKWKAIFSLGRSVTDTKGKLSRNGSVFMRAQSASEKTAIRPSKSMDSLCSLPTDDGKSPSGRGANGLFAPSVKSRTLDSNISYDPNEQDPQWEFDLQKSSRVIGGSPGTKRRGAPNTSSSSPSSSSSSSSPLQRALPEQLKVFKGDDLGTCRPTSPKNRRMLYSGSAHNGSSRPSFPGSLFPLESSPRHQRKALNISEPFAVSVPLRVSAVISTNSTPCRVAGKEWDRSGAKPPEPYGIENLGNASFRDLVPSGSGSFSLRDRERASGGDTSYIENPPGDSSRGSGSRIYSNNSSVPMEKEESLTVERGTREGPPNTGTESKHAEVKELFITVEASDTLMPSQPKGVHKESPSSSREMLNTSPVQLAEPKKLDQLDIERVSEEPRSNTHHELRITESETNILEDQLKSSASMTKITGNNGALSLNAQAKRRSSLPTHPVSWKGHVKEIMTGLLVDQTGATVCNPTLRTSPERPSELEHDIQSCYYIGNSDVKKDHRSLDSFESLDLMADKLQFSPFLHLKETDILQDAESWSSVTSSEDPCIKKTIFTDESSSETSIKPCDQGPALFADKHVLSLKQKGQEKENIKSNSLDLTAKVKGSMERLSKCLDERRHTTDISHQDDEDVWGSHLAGLDQVEPWEDLNSSKLWVTSPLHTPKLEDLFSLLKTSALTESKASTEPNINHSQKVKKVVEEVHTNATFSCGEHTAMNREADTVLNSASAKSKTPEGDKVGLGDITELFLGANLEGIGERAETKCETPQLAQFKTAIYQGEAIRTPKRSPGTPKQKISASSQRFHRQVSHEPCITERNEENIASKHRPYSLNLDLGHRCIRDISNRQNLDLADPSSSPRGTVPHSGTKHDGLSVELEMFLQDRQAPMRRNSAPVSVSSVRTAFMIKTCQAKAVPVIPPKIQYSHIPHPVAETDSRDQDKTCAPEREAEQIKVEKADSLPPLQIAKDPKEERENCEPVTRIQRQGSTEKPTETFKSASAPEPPVLRRKRSANGDSFMDCPRPERSTLLQRSSFRNRPRPQSLILFSPPFPIMDYPPVGDDGKLALSPIKSPTETSALDVFTKELAENLKTPEGVTLRNKMTLPKSGQRLETSTSCFYQPQRRSMIFDSRSNRQIE